MMGELPAPPEIPGLRLGRWLGAGSRGSVWAAVREADGRAVAVKVVVCADADAAAQVAREVAVLGGVDVEGLVGFHGALGVAGEPPAVAIVLDLVAGGSLHEVLRARGHLSLGEAVTVLTPVARTLSGLHAIGVVHGDLSPANVLLESSGRPLVADLGLARVAGEARGEAWGTDGFAAPEVVAGDAPTGASDVYALGALAWLCATGSAPGPGLLRRPLEELAPGLPERWRQITLRALSADPARRPSAAEAAMAYFDAAPAEPLRLVLGGDQSALLTHRLRREVVPPVPVPSRRDRRRAAHRGRIGGSTRIRVAVVTVAGVLAVATTVGVTGAVTGSRSGLVPGGADHARDPATEAAADPAADRAAAPAADPAADPRVARRDPVALMQVLADVRADAMNAADPLRLARLDAPSSAALARDTADLASVVASGRRYAGVALRVRSARAVQVTAARATLEAVIDTAAYQVTGGARSAVGSARAGERLRFFLVWSQGRWRVERVERPRRPAPTPAPP